MSGRSNDLSEETQAILLLCAPLVAAKVKDASPLSPGEFNDLHSALQLRKYSITQLLSNSESILPELHPQFDIERLKVLLGRGFALSLAVEKWTSHGLWVISREDSSYPKRLKERLKHLSPLLLYGCGDPSLLESGGLAIVGSRDIDEHGVDFTRALGEACAREQMTVISGGARGVDQFAMLSAVQAGGRVVGVMADSLARSSTAANARDAIRESKLTLVSPFDPEAGFNVGNAMSRNKVIYALADYGVVVSSGVNEGGTWSGAIEQLEKYKLIPVFARDGKEVPEGNKRLLSRGGLPFPPAPWEDLQKRLAAARPAATQGGTAVQQTLL